MDHAEKTPPRGPIAEPERRCPRPRAAVDLGRARFNDILAPGDLPVGQRGVDIAPVPGSGGEHLVLTRDEDEAGKVARLTSCNRSVHVTFDFKAFAEHSSKTCQRLSSHMAEGAGRCLPGGRPGGGLAVVGPVMDSHMKLQITDS